MAVFSLVVVRARSPISRRVDDGDAYAVWGVIQKWHDPCWQQRITSRVRLPGDEYICACDAGLWCSVKIRDKTCDSDSGLGRAAARFQDPVGSATIHFAISVPMTHQELGPGATVRLIGWVRSQNVISDELSDGHPQSAASDRIHYKWGGQNQFELHEVIITVWKSLCPTTGWCQHWSLVIHTCTHIFKRVS